VLAGVLAIAALISYTHLRAVFVHAGSPWPDLGPLLVDGLFASAWLRMRRRRREGVPVGYLAVFAAVLSVVGTLAGNVTAAYISGHRDWLAYIVAAWPAAAFALDWELVTGHAKQAVTKATKVVTETPVTTKPAPKPPAVTPVTEEKRPLTPAERKRNQRARRAAAEKEQAA